MKMRTIIALFALLVSFPSFTNAQVDVSMEPVAILWGRNLKVGAEYAFSPKFGLSADIFYSHNTNIPIIGGGIGGNGFGARIMPRYYPRPGLGTDDFYIAPYAKYRQISGGGFGYKRATAGVFVGYKILFDSGFLIDMGIGAGRRFYQELTDVTGKTINGEFQDAAILAIDIPVRLAVGYRLGTIRTVEKAPKKLRADQIQELDDRKSRKKDPRKSSRKKKKKRSKSRT